MRSLKTSDLFSFARVIKASGVREELTDYIQRLSKQDNTDVSKIGFNTMLMIMEALSDKKAEKAIYEALAPVFEMTVDQIQDLPPKDLFDLLKQMAEEDDLANFMGSVFGTLGKN
jgi:phosphoenolpyruvate synthase/pyruvate phosphate dikinase